MKSKIGFIVGVLAFVAILFITPSKAMIYCGLKIVAGHSDSGVIQELGVPHKEITLKNSQELYEKSKTIFVSVPKNFSVTGERGIKLAEPAEAGTTLHSLVNRQVKGLIRTLALAALMAIFWICEVLPLPIVALFPMVFLPAMEIAHYSKVEMPGYFVAFAPYMHYLIVLFIGGFTIAEAMKKWGLHQRIALSCMSIIGFSPKMIIFAFMVSTAVLSMFVSNTATAAMMLPIGTAIIANAGHKGDGSGFGRALMLGIAYSASIGGIGTLIGTPPNLVFAGFADTLLGKTITFADWLVIGLPVVAILLPLTWIYLLKINKVKDETITGSKEIIREQLKSLGKIRGGELNTLIIFITVSLMWVFRSWWTKMLGLPWVNDAVVAVIGMLLFYLLPVNLKKWEFTLDWKTNLKIPWGTLLLFGGGLALGEALVNTGAAEFLAINLTALENVHLIVVLLAVVFLVKALSEITSNTAATNLMMPLLFFLSLAINKNPLVLMAAGAVAASLVFMLPVATPPNAIVHGSGYVSMGDMIKNGAYLEVVTGLIWVLLLYFILTPYISSL